MAAGNALTVQTTLPSIGKTQRAMANEANLLNKAARLVPDTETFLKTIMDKDIHSADMQNAIGAMNSIAGDYLSNYSEDPFYAFTQRGKKQTREMQAMVNNPIFKQMEIAKKQNDETIKKIRDSQLQNELVLDDFGRIAVRDATGARSFKYASEIDPTKEFVMDVNQDHALLDRIEGGQRIASYDVQSLEDTEKQIRETMKGLGKTQRKSEFDQVKKSFAGVETLPYGVTTTTDTENNFQQIESELTRLIEEDGLSPTAMKSLYSAYYRNNPQEVGTEGAEQRAKLWAFNQIGRIAEGQRIDQKSITTKKGLGGPDADSQALKPVQTAQAWASGRAFGQAPALTIANDDAYTKYGNMLPPQLAFSGEMGKDDNGNPIQMTRREDLNILEAIGDLNRPFIGVVADNQNLGIKAGDFVLSSPDIYQKGVFAFQPQLLTDAYITNEGNKSRPMSAKEIATVKGKLTLGENHPNGLTDAEKDKYLNAEGALNVGKIAQGKYHVARERGRTQFGSEDYIFVPEHTERYTMKDLGYTSTEEVAKEIRLRGGVPLDKSGSLWAIDDEGYTVDVSFVVTNPDYITGASLMGEGDARSLVLRNEQLVGDQRTTPGSRPIANNDNSLRTGNTGQAQGWTNLQSIKNQ